jgi:hypothetical protein
MATHYVKSTASGANDGTSWADAFTTLAGASAIAVAGDTIWVSQAHAESTAANLALDWNGTTASPMRIICGNDAAEPPTSLATTATIETTGATEIRISTGIDHFYMYGLTFSVGVGSGSVGDLFLNTGTGAHYYEACTFHIANTSPSSQIWIAPLGIHGETICQDCHFKFSEANQQIGVVECFATIRGGSLLSGTTPTDLFTFGSSAGLTVEGFDCSAVASTMRITDSSGGSLTLQLRNCKLPASWGGVLNSTTAGPGSIFDLHNSDSTDTNYRYKRQTQFGTIDSEIIIVRSDGASDGVTAISWKMVTNANPEWNHHILKTGEIVRWNTTTGSAITATIEILHDSVTNMTNQQIWLEVQYLGTSGFPLSLFINDSSGDYLSTPADQASSSEAWTTTGLTNPNKQKLSVTFTPQEKGFIHAVVKVAMASKTVYVDPKMVVT